MKLLVVILALALYAFTLVNSFVLTGKMLKCHRNCDLREYQPICGTDDAGETKTFDNLCIMKTENCLRELTFQKTADGKCP